MQIENSVKSPRHVSLTHAWLVTTLFLALTLSADALRAQSPEVWGVFTAGYWAPRQRVPDLYLKLSASDSGGRCVGPGMSLRTDSAGRFRFAPAALQPGRPLHGLTPGWLLCLGPMRDTTVLMPIFVVRLDRRVPVHLRCEWHGDQGSPVCTEVSGKRECYAFSCDPPPEHADSSVIVLSAGSFARHLRH